MKTVKVRYSFEIECDVSIDSENAPAPYTREEWEEQQVLDVGDRIQMAIPYSKVNWVYEPIS